MAFHKIANNHNTYVDTHYTHTAYTTHVSHHMQFNLTTIVCDEIETISKDFHCIENAYCFKFVELNFPVIAKKMVVANFFVIPPFRTSKLT